MTIPKANARIRDFQLGRSYFGTWALVGQSRARARGPEGRARSRLLESQLMCSILGFQLQRLAAASPNYTGQRPETSEVAGMEKGLQKASCNLLRPYSILGRLTRPCKAPRGLIRPYAVL